MDLDEPEEELAALAKPVAVAGGGEPTKRPGGSTGKYRECLKNHAVNIGGHAVDGCGEFMPAGDDGSVEALRCAACGCHRNFHRKDSPGANAGDDPSPFSPYYRTTPAGYLHHHHHHHLPPPRPLALPSTSQEEGTNPMAGGGGGGGGASSSGKKRFRTKFTVEQKEKMLAFAERLGWRIQKHDEAAVQEFCNETSVKRHVLKVWMHNNKHTLGKKP
ncbi:Homeodomain ZF-HD class domain-containing protein [Dioscorea alata]|uniref:Homeodomain ZF-HD class domain-containing protein n=1 Tax=Dioscorea alata TaxID=55571 RepID=A0ACB7U5A3_DIOAL|nr:Homeodomain ZF-HD class domain-containing protein [Dioscorea alata]